MTISDGLTQLVPRLGVLAFGGLIAFLIAVHVFSAIDWFWFLPDTLWGETERTQSPAPWPKGCITMPDGTVVCDGPASDGYGGQQ